MDPNESQPTDSLLESIHKLTVIQEQCENCHNDFYEQKINEIIFYKLTGLYSSRICNLTDPYTRKKQQEFVATVSANYQLYCCRQGNVHLGVGNRIVPMVAQVFRLVKEAHGSRHRDCQIMEEIIRSHYESLYYPYMALFVKEFPTLCAVCNPNKVNYNPTDTLWGNLLHLKLPIAHNNNPTAPLVNRETLLQMESQLCWKWQESCEIGMCESDQYEPEYLVCLFIFKQRKFPILKYSRQIDRFHAAVRIKLRDLEIRVCCRGTQHFWYRKKQQRILMKNQVRDLIDKLHHYQPAAIYGSETIHRQFDCMIRMLLKETKIYPYNVMGAIEKYLAQCPKCCKHDDHFSLKQPVLEFEPEQLQKFRKDIRHAQGPRPQFEQCESPLSMSPIQSESQSLPVKQSERFMEKGMESDQSLPTHHLLNQYKNQPQFTNFLSNDCIWQPQYDQDYPPHLLEFEQEIVTDQIVVKKYGYDRFRRVIVVVSQTMKELYKKYGDCICLDFVNSPFNRRSPEGWEIYMGLFPKVSSQATHKALQFRIFHFINWFYVTERLKKDLANQKQREEMMRMFCRLMTHSNPVEYEEILKKITERMVASPVLDSFLEFSDKYCLTRMPPSFIGVSISTHRLRRLYDAIEQTFTYQDSFAKFICQVFQLGALLDQLGETQSPDEEPFDYNEELEQLKEVLCPSILAMLLESYNRQSKLYLVPSDTSSGSSSRQITFKNQIESLNRLKQSVQQRDQKGFSWQWVLEYYPEHDMWVCPCNWVHQTGIPCPHLLKVVTHHSGSITYYLNQRWLKD